MEDVLQAGCLCRALRLTVRGKPLRTGVCHCLDCRKHHGAVFYAAAIFAAQQVEIRGDYREYRGRCFCPVCGGSVFAKSDGEIEVTLGAFDSPDVFRPEYELWTIRRESWLPPFEGLAGFPKDRD